MPLISFTDTGLYCAQGDFYIDPWKPVAKAVITHAHSDHARPGSNYYLCHHQTKILLQLRLGEHHYESIGWNEPINMNGVRVSLHPAGHIIGSSQVRLEYRGEVWVVSGDYKTEDDGISGRFEPINCHHFVTESTFGLPIYQWQPQEQIFDSIRKWIQSNKESGFTSLLLAYSLGKSQRLIKNLAGTTEHIFLHGAIDNTQQALASAGWQFPPTEKVTGLIKKDVFNQNLVIAPGSAADSPWIKRLQPVAIASCSGWMQVRGNIRRRNMDAGFALSDHADWPGLLKTVKATGAEKVYVTHGFQAVFSRYLQENGVDAVEVKTAYGDEEEGLAEPTPAGAEPSETINNDNDE